MRKGLASLLVGVLGILMMIAGLAAPALSAGAPVAKVGYVDLQSTLEKTKAGKLAKGKLEAEKQKKQQEIDKKQKDLQAAAAELDKQRTVLKPDVVQKRESELQQQFVELQQQFAAFQQDLLKQEGKLTREIFKDASKIIESIAKRDGFTMILEKTEGAVLWADKMFEITDEVNKRMDAGEGGK
jgi:outer membrane protein